MTPASKRRWLKSGMPKRKKSAWVVIICEIDGPPSSIAKTTKNVSSSLKAAEAEVKRGWTAPFSWYEVERRLLDDSDSDPREIHYYSHKGRPQKAPPEKRATFYFERFLKRHPELNRKRK